MIEVKNISMSYGKKEVLKDISFQIGDGEVIGLLGENGAGKSTTMNILTGYLKPNGGEVLIEEVDMMKHPIEAKKKIGYLPEVPPLYKDMKVVEYLEYAARLKKRKDVSQEVKRVMDLFDLYENRLQVIKHLSKGWQQRVGFAGSLIGNPPFLILDEPLVGLDPSESKKVRELIKELSKDHTIMISSHILKEIEELCTGILILKNGTIAFHDSMEKARHGNKNTYKLVVKGEKDKIMLLLTNSDLLRKVEFVKEQEESVYEFLVEAKQSKDIRDSLLGLLVGKKFSVYGVERFEQSLEDMFLTMNKEGK